MFEDIGPPFYVYKYRPEPRTPAGDELMKCDTKEQADLIAEKMNRGMSLHEAQNAL